MESPTPDDVDAELMRRLAAGHDAALNSLMERHAEKLFHYLLRCLHNEDDAADLAQDTFVRVYQHRARFDPKYKFTTWLYTIAANLVRDRYRWRSRHPRLSLDTETASGDEVRRDLAVESQSLPDQHIQAEERAESVRRAIAELPEELRQPLILAEYEERSHAEIGVILGCSAKAVETRIYRARQQLRRKLAPLLRNT